MDLELATGERTRRVHLVPYGETGHHNESVAICNGMTAGQHVPTDPWVPMVEQVTCANCRKAAERLRRS